MTQAREIVEEPWVPKTPEEDHWLIEQLANWPRRVDLERTTNITFLMKAAARRIQTLEEMLEENSHV